MADEQITIRKGSYQLKNGARFFVHGVSKGVVTYSHRLTQWDRREEPVSEFQKKVKCKLKHLHPRTPTPAQ